MGTVITVLVILAIIGGIFVMLLNSPVGDRKTGYTSEWCERYIGRIKVGGEEMTGRYSGLMSDGKRSYDAYIVMTRNDDLNPPYQLSRTIQCPDCQMIVFPIGGCRCNVTRGTDDKWLKPLPTFKKTAPCSLAHEYFVGWPEKA